MRKSFKSTFADKKYRLLTSLSALLLLALFVSGFINLMNLRFPALGHDSAMLIDRLIIGKFHLDRQGIQIPYYSAYMCGGGPFYGQPDGFFYSITQFASFFVDFWAAMKLTIVVNIVLGYFGWFLVGRDVLRITSKWSHLLALLIVSNGFYFSHAFIGHWNFYALPMLGFLYWAIYDRRKDTLRTTLIKISVFSLVTAWILYSAGYYILMFFLLGATLSLPLDLLIHHKNIVDRLITILYRGIPSAIGAVLISSSKLVAVYNVMKVYPRTSGIEWVFSDEYAVEFAFKAFFSYPLNLHNLAISPTPHLDEKSFLLSPIILIGLFAGIFMLVRSIFKNRWKNSILFLGTIYTILLVVIFSHLASSDGTTILVLRRIPFFSSVRYFIRFLYIPSIFLTVPAAWAIARLVEEKIPKAGTFIVILFSLTTVGTFYFSHRIPIQEGQYWLPYSYQTVSDLRKLLPDSIPKNVSNISYTWSNFATGTAGKSCSSGLVQWAGISSYHHQALTDGSIFIERGGRFNMMKPACLAYPEENDCEPFERITIDDHNNLAAIASGRQPDWPVSFTQRFSNFVSVGWLLFSSITLIGASLLKKRKKKTSRENITRTDKKKKTYRVKFTSNK